jgi:hypothetical protein
MTSMEWRHLWNASQHANGTNRLAPSDTNTIFTLHNETLELLYPDNGNVSHLTDIMIELTMNDVMKELYRLRSQQVVYLAHPVHVEDPKDRWGHGLWVCPNSCDM